MNPLGSQGQVQLFLRTESRVKLSIYDVRGRRVRTLGQRSYLPGLHSVQLEARADDGSHLGPGIYFVKLEVAGERFTQRFVVFR